MNLRNFFNSIPGNKGENKNEIKEEEKTEKENLGKGMNTVQNNENHGWPTEKARTHLLKNMEDPGNYIDSSIEKAKNLTPEEIESQTAGSRGGVEERPNPEEDKFGYNEDIVLETGQILKKVD